jgi:hypothetical protein
VLIAVDLAYNLHRYNKILCVDGCKTLWSINKIYSDNLFRLKILKIDLMYYLEYF